MDRKSIIIALGFVLTGISGGYALGGYATGAQSSGPEPVSWWSTAASAADTPIAAAEGAATVADGPERYVCRGCGPTLAQRQSYDPPYDPGDDMPAVDEGEQSADYAATPALYAGDQPQKPLPALAQMTP